MCLTSVCDNGTEQQFSSQDQSDPIEMNGVVADRQTPHVGYGPWEMSSLHLETPGWFSSVTYGLESELAY